MKRLRINLDGLPEIDRPVFLSAFVERFAQALNLQFPPEFGYQHSGGWGLAPFRDRKGNPAVFRELWMASWKISRGPFWALHVTFLPEDWSLRCVKVTIEGYFPALQPTLDWILDRVDRLSNLPGQAFLGHILIPILLLPVMAIVPFMALYRLAKLWLHADVLATARLLDSCWPEIQASWPGVVSLSHPMSRFAVYSLALAATTAGFLGCFWLAGLLGTGEGGSIALYIIGAILALISVGLLIALVMTMLGMDVGR